MKRYRDSVGLIILNIIFEYLLILLTYVVCGLIRNRIAPPYGREFPITYITDLAPFTIVVGLFMMSLCFIFGDYYSIHFRNVRRIVFEVLFVCIVGALICAFIVFIFEDKQFSRILLGMLVIAWTIVLSVKRVLFQWLANRLFANKISTYNVMLIGAGESARKYIKVILKDTSSRYRYVGYLSNDNHDEEMGQYLGDYEKMYEVITNNHVDKVIIAEESLNRKFLNDILSVCGVFGVEAEIIPVFADYLLEAQKVKTDNGFKVLSVRAFDTSNILGVNVSVTDMDKTISDISDNLDKWRGKYICVSNVHTTVMAHDDPDYMKIQNGAVMALPDGGPLSSYSRSEGKKGAKRVTGPDLMRELLMRSREHEWKHFFYGSSQKTLDMLSKKIEAEYKGAKVVGMISPPYREITAEEDARFVEEINEANPDFVWVGLGAPKQEIWMAAHQDRINAVMIGVGAAFDYESGNLKRAPEWMQRMNLEWLYRFMQEPRRLFKRYFITNVKFLWLTRR